MAEYIDREKLLKEIDEAIDADGLGYVVGQTMKRYLERQSAADVAPVVHGNWEIKLQYGGTIWNRCTECGNEESENYGIPAMCTMWYCPKCGAKMDNRTNMYWDEED